MESTLKIYQDSRKEFRWQIRGKGNNKIVVASSEGFKTHEGATDNIALSATYLAEAVAFLADEAAEDEQTEAEARELAKARLADMLAKADVVKTANASRRADKISDEADATAVEAAKESADANVAQTGANEAAATATVASDAAIAHAVVTGDALAAIVLEQSNA